MAVDDSSALPIEESKTSAREQRNVRDAYGLALGLILASTFALVATGAPVRSPMAVAAGVLELGALVATLRVSGVNRRSVLGGSALAIAIMLIVMVALFVGTDLGRAVGVVLWLVLLVFTITAIGRRLSKYTAVNIQLVLGLLCVYVLIGLVFSFTYALVEQFDPATFAPGVQGIAGTTYFSFVSLATVGYGDITAVNNVARALAVTEGLLGQLYLVSVVSLAVSRLGDRNRQREV